MKTRTKTIAAVTGLVLLGGLGAAGASYADNWRGGHGGYYGEHHRGHGMGHGGMFGDDDHGSRMGRHFMGMFDTFDTNGDGKLTQDEIDQERAKRLAAFDADGDGKLTLKEYEALWLDAMRERMVDRFQSHDDDGDGFVTVAEFSHPYDKVVRLMDRNGDGAISRDDMGPRERHRDRNDD